MLAYPKQPYSPQQPSLISSLYRYWEQYKIPAIYYHYTLSILAQKPKEQQKMFMNKEIKLLRLGTHPYHIITDLIVSRQQSLQVISKNVDCLNAAPREHPFIEQNQFQREYSNNSRNSSKNGQRFIGLINNIKLYRKMTMQVVSRIYDWAKQLHHNQYKGIIQFIFKHQDYLQKIITDTNHILKQNETLFENNPLLILKREHQNTQNGLIFKYLKINEEQARKIESILEIITTHHALVENKRLLGIFKSSRSRKTLMEINHFDKLFCNLNQSTLPSKNYKTAEISNQNGLKSSRTITNPKIYSDMQSTGIYHRESPLKMQSKQFQLGRSQSQVLINHSFYKQKQPKTNPILTSSPQIPTQYDISFQFQNGIEVTQIYNYLRNNIFKNQNVESRQIEAVARNIIKQKDLLSFIKIKVGQLLVGWIAVLLNPKDQFFRRVADIIHLYKFMKAPTLHQAMINHFISLGYGLVKQAGQTIYQGEHKYRKIFNLITITWQIKDVKRDRLKKVIKDHSTLKGSRLLKYYSYSTQTKYHKYCVHQQNLCKVQFKFDVATKVYIQSKVYYRVKCDRVKRKGELLIIQNHINELLLILSKKLQAVLDYEKNNFDISYQISKVDTKDQQIKYVCFPQTKSIKKYISRDQQDIILQKLQINQTITEVLSVSLDINTISSYLVVDQSYIIALACNNQEDYGKTAAIVLIK